MVLGGSRKTVKSAGRVEFIIISNLTNNEKPLNEDCDKPQCVKICRLGVAVKKEKD